MVSGGGIVKVTENGSMEMEELRSMMDHINNYVRKFVPPSVSYVLVLRSFFKERFGMDRSLSWK